MAIKLGATETDIVICALEDYRNSLLRTRDTLSAIDARGEDLHADELESCLGQFDLDIAAVDRLLKSYRRSFKKLSELGVW